MGIFPKLFVAVMAHIIMENADKKIKLLIICFHLKIMDIILSFFLWASLYLNTGDACSGGTGTRRGSRSAMPCKPARGVLLRVTAAWKTHV